MSFEDVMMKRLTDCGTEACREIERGLEAGRPLGDAVLDAIESLPASKTRDLRRWVDDWEAWEEWKGFEKNGWRGKRIGKYVYLMAPKRFQTGWLFDDRGAQNGPSLAAVAAFANARDVRFHDYNFDPRGEWPEEEMMSSRYQARYLL